MCNIVRKRLCHIVRMHLLCRRWKRRRSITTGPQRPVAPVRRQWHSEGVPRNACQAHFGRPFQGRVTQSGTAFRGCSAPTVIERKPFQGFECLGRKPSNNICDVASLRDADCGARTSPHCAPLVRCHQHCVRQASPRLLAPSGRRNTHTKHPHKNTALPK